MAQAKTDTYATLEAANSARDAENAAAQAKGEGKPRFTFAITQNDQFKFYVVATLSGKARAIAALALDVKANVAEKKAPEPRKSVAEQVAAMKPDELAKIRELLANMPS